MTVCNEKDLEPNNGLELLRWNRLLMNVSVALFPLDMSTDCFWNTFA